MLIPIDNTKGSTKALSSKENVNLPCLGFQGESSSALHISELTSPTEQHSLANTNANIKDLCNAELRK